MSTYVSVAVVGGGMAGLAAAAMATLHTPQRVVLIEKKERLGCKVRVSGSGQCNLTHISVHDQRSESLLTRYGDRKNFVKPALCHWTPHDTIEFFDKRGCPCMVEENGKVFPKSRRAADVVGVLEETCRSGDVEIVSGDAVSTIEVASPRFRIVTKSGAVWEADNVVLATGGKSYPQTGSSGDGYKFAAALGHRVVEPRPALAPIFVNDWPFASVSGISLRGVDGELIRGDTTVRRFGGDVLFTHRGLSGPAILDVSRFAKAGDTVRLNLLSHESSRSERVRCGDCVAADKELLRLMMDATAKTVRRTLAPLALPDALVTAIFAQLQIPLDIRVASCDAAARKRLAKTLVAFDVVASRLGSWDEAMVTAGGVDTLEVNPKTMESRIVPGLFFAGELLDVDGDCGGFNLQWAMSSACLTAHAICIAKRSQ
ncbi:MAG: NAD(P)/FAD-dependent oxidoreductase [Thermoguttaceae bacterium]